MRRGKGWGKGRRPGRWIIPTVFLVGMVEALIICLATNKVLDVGPVHVRLPGPEMVVCQMWDAACNGNPWGFPVPEE